MSKSINLSELPKKGAGVDWLNSIGYKCPFEIEGFTGEVEIVKAERVNNVSRITLRYKDKETTVQAKTVRNGGGLKDLTGITCKAETYSVGQIVKKEEESFEILELWTEKEEGKRNKSMLKIKCLSCGNIYDMTRSGFNQLKYCTKCNKHSTREVTVGINDIPTTDPWMIPYFQGGEDEARKYRNQSQQSLIFKCPVCGKLADKKRDIRSLYIYHTIGCSCSGSTPMTQVTMGSILKQKGINYIAEMSSRTFAWTGKYRYDFYLPDFNCIIETHGLQHYVDGKLWKSLEEQQESDAKKKQLALDNGIEHYFEIDCSKSSIEFIINSAKNAGLFDFLNIDDKNLNFENVAKIELKDRIELYKEIINNNPNITRIELAEELGLKADDPEIHKILEILQVDIQTYANPVIISKNGMEVAEFRSIYAFVEMSKNTPYHLTYPGVHKLCKSGDIFGGKYTIKFKNK